MPVATIHPTRLAELASAGSIELLDVRTPVEFQEVHATFARNVPLDRLDPDKLLHSHPATEPLYVICRTGSRGQQAAEKLLAAGFTHVVNVEGGTLAWAEGGLPVVRGQKMMSLERQVRIAAGALVVIAVLLGWFVHEGFHGLAGFVGAGLVFAGVSDTCGMGLLLARMPWNRAAASSCTSK